MGWPNQRRALAGRRPALLRWYGRWWRFNAVSLAGFGVQAAVLALLLHAGADYLVATAVAVEISVLHNFAWHRRWTFRDRGRERAGASLLRFHLSNGAVSMAGNLLFMRMLVGEAGMPALWANLLSNALCGLLNFLLADRWAFCSSRS